MDRWTKASALTALAVPMGAAVPAAVAEADPAAIAEAVRPSLVRVEYTLRYDRGEAPPWDGDGDINFEELIDDERPLETAGFLLDDVHVVARDTLLDPRFVETLEVRFGDDAAAATPSAWAVRQGAVILKLAAPLEGAEPLKFVEDDVDEASLHVVHYRPEAASWTVYVSPMQRALGVGENGDRMYHNEPEALVVDADGRAVGVMMDDAFADDADWRGSPMDWPLVSAEAMAATRSRVEDIAKAGVPRVRLTFRSPESSAENLWDEDEQESMTEWNGSGLLLDERTVLVLANLRPEATGRLERVLIHTADRDEPVEAEFVGTLRDYGAFVARLPEPVSGAAVIAEVDARDWRDRIVMAVDARVHGPNRLDYVAHTRLIDLTPGWKRRVHPVVAGTGSESRSDVFAFSRDGELLGLTVERRRRIRHEEWEGDQYYDRWYSNRVVMTPMSHLLKALNEFDPNNVPLGEDEHRPLAWLGVELQSLTPELARVNDVSHETRDGETGAIVTHVYADSPAAEAGLKPGDVLLRLHADGLPRPMEIEGDEESVYAMMDGFPWVQLDDIPVEAFEDAPAPWPSVETDFTTALTDLGLGSPYTLEVFRDGGVDFLELEVALGPDHYGNADRYESEPLGLTVRDVTFEVARYLRLKPDDPGVVISRVEPGGKAAVAGVKPFELVTHVNDVAVHDVGDFEAAAGPGGDLRLNVKRMTRGRVVKVTVDPAEPDAPEDSDDADVVGEDAAASGSGGEG